MAYISHAAFHRTLISIF